MTSDALNERITRALAFMLRHQPEEFDLELDRFGWGDLEDVLYALQERMGDRVSEDEVVAAIEASDRPRYEIEEGRIRALYGHSFPIDPGEPSEPPDELFIGVGSRDADRAKDSGLRSGRRAFLHLARTEEEARETGRRVARDYAVVTVYAGEAYDEGIEFYDRGSLYLADEVPVDFLEVGEIQHDGIDRDHGRRSRGRRTADGPRGPRRRGRGRGRGRGRDDRYEDDRDDDRPQSQDRGGQDRGGRSRGGRDRDERRDEPRREEPRRSRPAERETEEVEVPRAAPASSFGAGLVGDAPAPEPEATFEPEPERAPEPEAEPEVDVPRREAEAPPSGGGFGAGLD
ncbi:MAG: RNA 2'-phosphotransferase [Planctomycetota bacterium]